MKTKGFAQRMGSLEVPPTRITLAFHANDLLGLEEKINHYVYQMLVEIDNITMTHIYSETGGKFCALVVFRDQEMAA